MSYNQSSFQQHVHLAIAAEIETIGNDREINISSTTFDYHFLLRSVSDCISYHVFIVKVSFDANITFG